MRSLFKRLGPVRRRDDVIRQLRREVSHHEGDAKGHRELAERRKADIDRERQRAERQKADAAHQRERAERQKQDAERWRKKAADRAAENGLLKASRTAPTEPLTDVFKSLIEDRQRAMHQVREHGVRDRHALAQVPFKLRNYELAASHGVAIPEVLAVWSEPARIALDGLPDRFVLKSDGGANSNAVQMLERTDQGALRTVDGAREYTERGLQEWYASLGSLARPPFFAEELLEQPDGGPVPDDVKIYAFHGRVGHVLLRRVGQLRAAGSITSRYLDASGRDLGEVAHGRIHDPTIPIPPLLPQMLETARHLSRAVGLSFCRIDVYSTATGVVLGELTSMPGGPQRYRPDHAGLLRDLWVDADVRLQVDLEAGRPPGALHGQHPAPSYYPPSQDRTRPGAWERRRVDCQEWCSSTVQPGHALQSPRTG